MIKADEFFYRMQTSDKTWQILNTIASEKDRETLMKIRMFKKNMIKHINNLKQPEFDQPISEETPKTS